MQYIILDPTLGMSPGKLAAQAAHAAVEGVRRSAKVPHGNPWDESIVNRWQLGGHYAKVVLQADDLFIARDYIVERGFKVALIIDEGRTEFDGSLTPTALGTQIVDKDSQHVQETFGAFRLYKQPSFAILEATSTLSPKTYAEAKRLIECGEVEEAKQLLRKEEKPRNRLKEFLRGTRTRRDR